MGMQYPCGRVAGVVAPVITAIAIDRTGSFAAPFLMNSGITLLGIFAYRVLIPTVRPIDWEAITGEAATMRSSTP